MYPAPVLCELFPFFAQHSPHDDAVRPKHSLVFGFQRKSLIASFRVNCTGLRKYWCWILSCTSWCLYIVERFSKSRFSLYLLSAQYQVHLTRYITRLLPSISNRTYPDDACTATDTDWFLESPKRLVISVNKALVHSYRPTVNTCWTTLCTSDIRRCREERCLEINLPSRLLSFDTLVAFFFILLQSIYKFTSREKRVFVRGLVGTRRMI